MKPWQFIWPIGTATTDSAVLQLALGPDPGSRVVISRDGGRVFAHYSRTRVYLDRDAWEALEGPDDVLIERIRRPDSPEFTIALTRTELEAVFGPVRDTASWDQGRCYHFPIDPPATTSFLVTREGEPVTPAKDREPERRSWVSRADLGPILRTLFAEFGSAPIHGKILVERGLSPSAVKHPAYWSASQPGGKAAADVGLAGTLHRHVVGDQLRPELLLREVVQHPGSTTAAGPRTTKVPRAAALAANLDPIPGGVDVPRSVQGTDAPTTSSLPPPSVAWAALPAGPTRDWLEGVRDEGYRRVLVHVVVHGSVTEPDVASILGSAALGRRFARALDELVPATAPIRVRIDSFEGVKRYVRENG